MCVEDSIPYFTHVYFNGSANIFADHLPIFGECREALVQKAVRALKQVGAFLQRCEKRWFQPEEIGNPGEYVGKKRVLWGPIYFFLMQFFGASISDSNLQISAAEVVEKRSANQNPLFNEATECGPRCTPGRGPGKPWRSAEHV